MGLKMPSEGVSIAYEIPLRESVHLLLRRTMLGNTGLCLEIDRVLGTSVVCYSTGESSLSRGGESELLSGQGTSCTATYWGNAKSIVFDQVQVLQCCGLLSGGKRKETYMVRL